MTGLLLCGIGKLDEGTNLCASYTDDTEDTLATCINDFKLYVVKLACTECNSGVFLSFKDVLADSCYLFNHNVIFPY